MYSTSCPPKLIEDITDQEKLIRKLEENTEWATPSSIPSSEEEEEKTFQTFEMVESTIADAAETNLIGINEHSVVLETDNHPLVKTSRPLDDKFISKEINCLSTTDDFVADIMEEIIDVSICKDQDLWLADLINDIIEKVVEHEVSD